LWNIKLLWDNLTSSRAANGLSRNQSIALEYRKRQISVLRDAIELIDHRLDFEPSYDAFPSSALGEPTAAKTKNMEILSLEGAYRWMNLHHPEIGAELEQYIASDQDETLPLNWTALIGENWEHTYWTVWLYAVTALWLKKKSGFFATNSDMSQKALAAWLADMTR
jgi:hypothetical protein